jgi:hypothetical protein
MVTMESSPPRKSSHGRAGNRTQDIMISSQKLWPLDNAPGIIMPMLQATLVIAKLVPSCHCHPRHDFWMTASVSIKMEILLIRWANVRFWRPCSVELGKKQLFCWLMGSARPLSLSFFDPRPSSGHWLRLVTPESEIKTGCQVKKAWIDITDVILKNGTNKYWRACWCDPRLCKSFVNFFQSAVLFLEGCILTL